MKVLIILSLFGVLLSAQEIEQPYRFNRDSAVYWGSVSVLASAQVADHVSSRGLMEANPILRDRSGAYSAQRGAALKIGVMAGLIVLEQFDTRRHPKHRKAWAVLNYATAGVLYAVAARNARIKTVNSVR